VSVTAHEVTAGLLGMPGTVAEPREVTAGGVTYPAAAFSQQRELLEGSRARNEAVRARKPTTYQHEGLYVAGSLPRTYLRAKDAQRTLVYEQRGGQRWMVAAWATAAAVASHPESHPLGEWFLLQHVPDGLDMGPVWVDELEVTEL
jgi:hypothetical protein